MEGVCEACLIDVLRAYAEQEVTAWKQRWETRVAEHVKALWAGRGALLAIAKIAAEGPQEIERLFDELEKPCAHLDVQRLLREEVRDA